MSAEPWWADVEPLSEGCSVCGATAYTVIGTEARCPKHVEDDGELEREVGEEITRVAGLGADYYGMARAAIYIVRARNLSLQEWAEGYLRTLDVPEGVDTSSHDYGHWVETEAESLARRLRDAVENFGAFEMSAPPEHDDEEE